jgi:hypothetical protein
MMTIGKAVGFPFISHKGGNDNADAGPDETAAGAATQGSGVVESDGESFVARFIKPSGDFDFDGYVAARKDTATSNDGAITYTLDYLATLWESGKKTAVYEAWTQPEGSGPAAAASVLDPLVSLAIGVAKGKDPQVVADLADTVSTLYDRLDQLDKLKAAQTLGQVRTRVLIRSKSTSMTE